MSTARTMPAPGAPAPRLEETEEIRAARIALFQGELHRRLDTIGREAGAGALGQVAVEANALATGALAFGLGGLADDAHRLDQAARGGDRAAAEAALRRLQSGVHGALARLRGAG